MNVIRDEPVLRQTLTDLADRFPILKPLLPTAMIEHTFPAPSAECRDFLVSGIPRSGTSLVCHLLHRVQNCVVINEPHEVYRPLRLDHTPWRVAVLYRQLRAQILRGEPVVNKVDSSGVIQDTLKDDQRREYRPQVDRSDYLLGTKNTLAYCLRHEAIRRVMPAAKWVFCIRHPFDTIASWKTSFAHLAEVDLERFPACFPGDTWMTTRQLAWTIALDEVDDPVTRRAMLWRFLAETVAQLGNDFPVIKYERLIQQPATVLTETLDYLGVHPPIPALDVLRPRKRADELDRDECAIIREICGESARRLGYRID